MPMRTFCLIALMLFAAPVSATAECIWRHETVAAATHPLLDQLKAAKSEAEGTRIAAEIWQLWSSAPDATAQELLDKGVQRIGWGEFDTAESMLTELIDYCPGYAEARNQRAFARFLGGNFSGALEDIEKVLEIEPRHFGALAGRGLTLLRQGRQVLGINAIRDAVAVHPWINERHLLPPEERI